MEATYAAEIALVDNYLVIEKTTIAPLSDPEYFDWQDARSGIDNFRKMLCQ